MNDVRPFYPPKGFSMEAATPAAEELEEGEEGEEVVVGDATFIKEVLMGENDEPLYNVATVLRPNDDWLARQADVGAEALVAFFLHKMQVLKKQKRGGKRALDQVKSAGRGRWVTFACITDLLREIEKGGTVDEISDRVEEDLSLVCLR